MNVSYKVEQVLALVLKVKLIKVAGFTRNESLNPLGGIVNR